MERYTIDIEGIDVGIDISSHALSRMIERDVDKYIVYGLILQMGARILEMKNGEEFAIVDKDIMNGIVCSVNSIDLDLYIDVITVISGDSIYISRGLQTFRLKEVL